MQKFLKSSVFTISLLLIGSTFTAANIDQLISAGESRLSQAASAQKRIVAMADETDGLVSEYKQTLKVVDGLKIYNGLQNKQIANQEAEKTNLLESIDKVGDIENQMTPLMMKMISSITSFVEGDVPFLLDERRKRMNGLTEVMQNPNVTDAEKLRQVLQAYTIETDFGNTIERYTGKLNLNGNDIQVNFLRIGRLSLSYQSDDGSLTGAWNPETKAFEELAAADYKAQIGFGLKVAGKEISPDLFIVPVPAAQGAK